MGKTKTPDFEPLHGHDLVLKTKEGKKQYSS